MLGKVWEGPCITWWLTEIQDNRFVVFSEGRLNWWWAQILIAKVFLVHLDMNTIGAHNTNLQGNGKKLIIARFCYAECFYSGLLSQGEHT